MVLAASCVWVSSSPIYGPVFSSAHFKEHVILWRDEEWSIHFYCFSKYQNTRYYQLINPLNCIP